MSVKLLKFDDQAADIVPVSPADTVEAGQIMLDGVGGIALNAGGCLLSNLSDPMAQYDAATKGYVDSIVQAYAQNGYPSSGTTSSTPGQNGTSILAGQNAPDNSVGNTGDLYVQLANGPYLWGPKATNGWPTNTVLLRGSQGDRGPAGVPGYSIRQSPSDPPAPAFGNNGDFAVCTTGNLYGPKTNAAWPQPPLSLIGPAGQSIQGQAGASIVYSAVTPPSAQVGNNGDLSITQQGFLFGPKQSGSWGQAVASLLGPQGNQGNVGPASQVPGPQGNGIRASQAEPPPASLGIDGDFALCTGSSHLYGPRANGAWPSTYVSLVGPQGVGTQGSPGQVGPRGASILYSANDPPSNSLGNDNDLALTFDGLVYGPKNNGAWGTSSISLLGPAGHDGSPGQVGPRGAAVLQAQADPPDNGLGLPGDFAISPSAVLYGPKPQSNVWQSGGVALVGPRGAASQVPGPAGTSILTGNGAPSTQGNVGDVYLDLAGNLYAAKTTQGWSTSYTSLVGPVGKQGVQGVRGATITKLYNYASSDILPTGGFNNGDYVLTSDYYIAGPYSQSNGWPLPYISLVGPRGLAGQAGATIRTSPSTPDPNLGNVGDYVFEQDNYQFIGPKTSSGWPASGTSLRGAMGQSVTGPRGASVLQADANPPTSALGNVGDYALTADGHLYGPKQANGYPSASLYLVGAQGAPSQVPGPRGASIDSGNGPPTAQIGQDGDPAYLDILNGNLYGARANGAWPTSFTSLIGPQGKTVRGSQIYNGSGPPNSDLTTYSPNGPAQPNDLYLDVSSQILYVLGQ